MKKLFLLTVMAILFIEISHAQNVGIGTTTPNASSILEIKASDKGLLIPRTSTASRTAIANPAKGLMVYDTTANSFWYHNGIVWTQIGSSNGWSLTGNAGTDTAHNFIGTTDAQPLIFKVNNIRAGRLDYDVAKGNTSFGYLGLISNTTGVHNTAHGTYALYLNTTGQQNTASGFAAMYSNTTGNYNTGTGAGALNSNTSGMWNTANGAYALYENISGGYNTALGGYALYNNTTGYSNIAIGTGALFNITGESNLVAIGDSALYNSNQSQLTGGSLNTAIGSKALYSNTLGVINTATGNEALYLNTSGVDNTANGSKALFDNTTGDENTGIGSDALFDNTTGSFNTGIGSGSDIDEGLSNSSALGYNVSVNASNTCVIGNSAVTLIGGQVGWSVLSDGRFKKNIQNNVPGLSFITQLNPVTYNLDVEGFDKFSHTDDELQRPIARKNQLQLPPQEKSNEFYTQAMQQKEKIVYTGLVAQDVEQAANKIGYNFSGIHKPQNDKDNYSLDYGSFVVPLIKAVQEQQQIIEQQKSDIETQKNDIDTLKTQLAELTKAVNTLMNK